MSGICVLINSGHGQYIPNSFFKNFDLSKWQGLPQDIEDLSNCENPFYWDTWELVLNNAKFIDEYGNEWFLCQDEDLFACCAKLMTEDERINFFGDY